jgi:uncharacterized protein YyaL (SSP411 family)
VERCLKLFFPAMQKAASQFCSLCTALEAVVQPPSLLVLCGTKNETVAWRAALAKRYLPGLVIISLTGDETDLPAPLQKPLSSTTTAWLCHGTQCLPPITNPKKLLAALQ